MAKWMFLWNPPPETELEGFAVPARGEIMQRLGGIGASEIMLHLTEQRPPRLTVIPFTRAPVALVSVTGEGDELGSRAAERLRGLAGTLAGYLVEEALPVPRARTWALGEAAPGACLLTVFRRKLSLNRDQFLARWHGHHTPLSLVIHPLISYIRNTVMAPIIDRSPSWEGIVTEAYPTMAHLVNPLRQFGGPLRALPNMVRVGLDISSFIDLRSMENYLVTERVMEASS